MCISIVVKLLVGMVGILFFLRLAGKGQMSQITPLDTVNSFIIGALVGGVIYNPDLSIWLMLFAVLVWAIINALVRLLMKVNFFNRLLNGKSEYLIKDGILDLKMLKKNHLNMEQFKAILREHDIFSLLDVDDVRFETDGQLTVYRKKDSSESYLLVSNGEILTETLKEAKRSETWLKKEMHKLGFTKIENLFCVEWTPDRGFYIVDIDGKIQDITKKSNVKELYKDDTV